MCLAIPGKIMSITGDEPLIRTARVSFGGVIKEVHLVYVPQAVVGDYVIVHVGFALNILDEQEAAQIFEYLRQIAEAEAAEQAEDEVH